MRVLIINVNAFEGSTGKITHALYTYLKEQGDEVKVCFRGVKEKVIRNKDFIPLTNKCEFLLSVFLARLTGLEGHFSLFSTMRLKKVIGSFAPDIVQLYNIHGNYIRSYSLLNYLKKMGIPVVYSMLDEFPYMGKCAYPIDCLKFKEECCNCPQKDKYPESWFFDQSNRLFHKKKECYNDFDKLIFTGPPYVCQRAKQSFLLRNKHIEELYEPFDFSNYYPRETYHLKQNLGISNNERVVVCASGTYFRKGGHFFIEVAQKLQHAKDIRFVFVGYEESAGWTFPPNVIVLPIINDQNIFAEYMSLGDAYVCTSIGDTTPSVCLCALGCGTPIIGFDYGGVKDCAPNEYGTFVPIGNIEALATAISKVVKKTNTQADQIREYAMKVFSSNVVYKNQLRLYQSLIT